MRFNNGFLRIFRIMIPKIKNEKCMAGHSQFKNIMYRKGAQDAKKARIFAKLAREIFVSARSGAPDPTMNPRLRSALASARAANMPKDNIDRALKKAAGGDDTSVYEEIRYEGYGPGGIAIIVETLTDNRNRTASDVRSSFTKFGGHLGEAGSVSFQFEHIGMIAFSKEGYRFDQVLDASIEAGAENVEEDEEAIIVTCHFSDFSHVRDTLLKSLGDPVEAKIIWKPTVTASCSAEQEKSLLKLIDVLEDHDDVQHIYYNGELSHE
jgi:YebC/PmpR family DNA-binding regulatory protein